MGLQYRAIRAAATALLVAVALGAGGMAGMTSALAADPAMVELTGTVVDGSAGPLAGVHLTITVEHPVDGALAAAQATTAADGSFTADVFAWGTADAPATLTIAADEEIQRVEDSCSTTVEVVLTDVRHIALAEAAPDPLVLTATTTAIDGICGTTGTPPTGNSGTGNSGGGNPNLTPPPTDRLPVAALAGPADRLGPALSLGFVAGLLIAGAFLLPRPGARRRD